jgi:hypothetical protein
MLEKIVPIGSWPRMADQCVQIVKVSSRGLIGNDRRAFLEKRAGHHHFVDALDRGLIKLAKGDLPIHILAVGSTEGYGPNRNGDAWKEASCKGCFQSFAKHAKYFRHHRNKAEKGDPYYGNVKLAAYNDAMRRIECLTIGNMDKEAAERNGGLPMLAESLARIERGDDVAWSMACKVAHDVCANCGNKAANRDEYCTDDTCISDSGRHMFGCKHGLTKVGEDGFQQYVENPDSDFFDLSEVIRPAYHNCYGWKADYLTKAASDGHVIGGAELADLYAIENGETSLFSNKSAEQTLRNALLYKLASIESQVETDPSLRQRAVACAFTSSLQPPMDLTGLGEPGSRKLATALHALAGQKIAMPVRDFVRLVCKGDVVKAAALSESVFQRLPGVFNRLALDNCLTEKLASNPYVPAPQLAPVSQRRWAEKNAQWYSLDRAAVETRVLRSALRSLPIPGFNYPGQTKEASADAEQVVRQYAFYKLAFLGALATEPDFADLCELTVLQNYIA